MSRLLEACEVARAAGRILREGYGRPGAIDYKGGIDLVTYRDGLPVAEQSGTITAVRIRA